VNGFRHPLSSILCAVLPFSEPQSVGPDCRTDRTKISVAVSLISAIISQFLARYVMEICVKIGVPGGYSVLVPVQIRID